MNKIYYFFRQRSRDIILRILGMNALPSNGIHILNAHMSHKTQPDIKYMERTMMRLSKKVRFIKIEDAIRMIEQHVEVDEPLCAFTFDDGFEECYDYIAPVLEKYNINAIFFVNPHFVEGNDAYIERFTNNIVKTPGKRPMRWSQLQDLQRRGFIIGAHTMDHYLTASDNEEEVKYQIQECRRVIEEKLHCSCEHFAWPYGRIEHTTKYAVDIACQTYKYVFSQSDYKHYFSFGEKVINRRHFEPFWPVTHIKYFISCKRS